MNLEQKKYYLESYKRAREKYETLKCSLESVHSASYFECKDRNNKPSKTIVDKINEVDNAYLEQLDQFTKINDILLKNYDHILYCKYVCLMSDEEIANDNDMPTKEMKKWIDRRISKLSIV
jgi:hypothetical protein